MSLTFNSIKYAVLALALACAGVGCNRSSRHEAPITGKSSDPAVTMTARWQEGKRYIFRVESVNSTQVPRKNTTQLIQTETSVGQDLAFSVTNVAPNGSRVLQMEILAVQMETGRDDSITMSYDSGNQVMQVEDTPLVQRLRRFVGLKLLFRLSPDNKVTRIDNVRDLNDRQSGGGNIRGVAASVIGRCFNQQFYREVVEMGMLPKTPVKIGDTWTVDRPANAGPSGSPFPSTFTYKFVGWQQRMGTNCARLDFTGEFKPAPPPSPPPQKPGDTNPPPARVVKAPSNKSLEDSEITGRSWYSPEHTLAIETVYQQSITAKSTVGRVRSTTVSKVTETNATDGVEMEIADASTPPPNVPGPASGPQPVASTVTTTTHQSTSIKLIEVELLQP
ncbi:MAG: hypothetical protein IPK15_22615 [Verrucomicrobia bacterium]|nr:hypothetical protein [Verrucomicrobiota bacterium]